MQRELKPRSFLWNCCALRDSFKQQEKVQPVHNKLLERTSRIPADIFFRSACLTHSCGILLCVYIEFVVLLKSIWHYSAVFFIFAFVITNSLTCNRRMTLTVSTDLSVNTSPTQVEEKLQDKQKALRDSIEKGEPKIFGVSERRVMASIILKLILRLLLGVYIGPCIFTILNNKVDNLVSLYIKTFIVMLNNISRKSTFKTTNIV